MQSSLSKSGTMSSGHESLSSGSRGLVIGDQVGQNVIGFTSPVKPGLQMGHSPVELIDQRQNMI